MIARSRRGARNVQLPDYLIPVLRALAYGFVAFISSCYIVHCVFHYCVPSDYSRLLYFNYDLTSPHAIIHLTNANDQWRSHAAASRQSPKRFLLHGLHYKIRMTFQIFKSASNSDLGKFMAAVHIQDAHGNFIASSLRPVPIPYQSRVTSSLFSLIEFPLRLVGARPFAEYSEVSVPMINNFLLQKLPAVETMTFALGSNAVQLGDVKVVFEPAVAGLRHLMYSAPSITYFLLVGFLFTTAIVAYFVHLFLIA